MSAFVMASSGFSSQWTGGAVSGRDLRAARHRNQRGHLAAGALPARRDVDVAFEVAVANVTEREPVVRGDQRRRVRIEEGVGADLCAEPIPPRDGVALRRRRSLAPRVSDLVERITMLDITAGES